METLFYTMGIKHVKSTSNAARLHCSPSKPVNLRYPQQTALSLLQVALLLLLFLLENLDLLRILLDLSHVELVNVGSFATRHPQDHIIQRRPAQDVHVIPRIRTACASRATSAGKHTRRMQHTSSSP